MQKTLGPDLDLSWMTDQNPLPPTAVLYSTISDSVPASNIIEKVHNLSGVEKVHSNPFQLQAAAAWSQLASTVVWPLITVLLATQAVLLANTVRMSMTKLHGDIHVLRLVGAARWAYHAPILTRMSLLTLLGTGLALAGAKLIQIRVDMILSAPPFHLGCPFVSWPEVFIIFLGAGLVTILSSALAIYWQDQV
jgi:cell division transport system permease protein